MFPPPHRQFLELAIFRFEDVCIEVQAGMDGFLRTAALEVKPGVEAVFRWLRRRGVGICLLTDYCREDFTLLLDRLGWSLGQEGTVHLAVAGQSDKPNPVRTAIDAAGLISGAAALVVSDTVRLLECARASGCRIVFGVMNGSSSYPELAASPFGVLLDNALQLPDHLLRMLPDDSGLSGSGRTRGGSPPRLWYPTAG